jgi:hypothetical protein
MIPPFTRKHLRAASTKRPMDWRYLSGLPTRYNVALQDVLKGESSQSSRVDLATLYNFMLSAKELGLIDDGGMADDSAPRLAAAYTRAATGKSFRLDGRTAEVIKEMIATFEMVARAISERDYMRVCNHVPTLVK